jgi:hypothetical protein
LGGLWRTGHARFTSTAGVFYLHMLNDFKGCWNDFQLLPKRAGTSAGCGLAKQLRGDFGVQLSGLNPVC